MKVHKLSWTFSALIHHYMPKRWTCHGSKSWGNRKTRNRASAIADTKHLGASVGLKLKICQEPGAFPKSPQFDAVEGYLEEKKNQPNTKINLKNPSASLKYNP